MKTKTSKKTARTAKRATMNKVNKVKTRGVKAVETAKPTSVQCACGCGTECTSKGALRKAAKGLPTFALGHDHRLLCELVKEAGGLMALCELVRGVSREASR